jgi:ferredoxin
VHVADAWIGRVEPPGADEAALLSFLPDYDANRSRLSCQIAVSADIDGLELTIVSDP